MKTIICKDCEKDFFIEDAEAEWYKAKGFDIPKRCKACRAKRKN